MKREVVDTGDGSKTIRIIDLEENYHSSHGALQEAMHVFIENGLKATDKKDINIFEMGFGTGLNAFITGVVAKDIGKHVFYQGVEAYPVSKEELEALSYSNLLGEENKEVFDRVHDVEWERKQIISDHLEVLKNE